MIDEGDKFQFARAGQGQEPRLPGLRITKERPPAVLRNCPGVWAVRHKQSGQDARTVIGAINFSLLNSRLLFHQKVNSFLYILPDRCTSASLIEALDVPFEPPSTHKLSAIPLVLAERDLLFNAIRSYKADMIWQGDGPTLVYPPIDPYHRSVSYQNDTTLCASSSCSRFGRRIIAGRPCCRHSSPLAGYSRAHRSGIEDVVYAVESSPRRVDRLRCVVARAGRQLLVGPGCAGSGMERKKGDGIYGRPLAKV